LVTNARLSQYDKGGWSFIYIYIGAVNNTYILVAVGRRFTQAGWHRNRKDVAVYVCIYIRMDVMRPQPIFVIYIHSPVCLRPFPSSLTHPCARLLAK